MTVTIVKRASLSEKNGHKNSLTFERAVAAVGLRDFLHTSSRSRCDDFFVTFPSGLAFIAILKIITLFVAGL